jgi:hypothetical protein
MQRPDLSKAVAVTGHDVASRAAERFLSRPAKQSFGGLIPAGDLKAASVTTTAVNSSNSRKPPGAATSDS